jgi:hypothetical protein
MRCSDRCVGTSFIFLHPSEKSSNLILADVHSDTMHDYPLIIGTQFERVELESVNTYRYFRGELAAEAKVLMGLDGRI